MSANKNKGGGGSVALLLMLAGALLWPSAKPAGKVKAKAHARQQPAIVESAKLKVARYYEAKVKDANLPTANDIEYAKFQALRKIGAKPNPTRAILEKEAAMAAAKHGIDHRIFKALVRVESAWNPRARSSVGAISLSQVMPQNAKRCGLKTAKELWDPIKNLHCGAQILSEDLRTYGGNMRNALKSYNCGRINCPPAEQYASKILSLSEKMKG